MHPGPVTAVTPGQADEPLYVRDVTHPNGECPLHGTKEGCPCTDTGLFTERELREGWTP